MRVREVVLRFPIALLTALACALGGVSSARCQVSDDIVKIGVLNDQSGLYADLGGPGSAIAARMAVEDAGGTVLGKPVEIAVADHQNKADIGAAIARRWFDAERVDMAIGFDNSSVALAVEQLAAERNRIAIAGAVGSTAFTGKACTATEASWIYDSYALTTSLARSVVAEGRDTWFFLTVDYAFGHSLEADATGAVLRGRRQSARQRPPSAQHRRLQFLSAAGAGVRRESRGARQWRRRHGQRHQTGGRVRAGARRSNRRGACWFSLPTCTAWDCRPRRG